MTGPSVDDTWFAGLPSGWDVVPLRFLARFQSGGTPDKGNREFWDGEIPWVSPKDMKVDRIGDSEDHVTGEALAETSLSMVPTGSVLLVVRGMILAHSIPVAVTTAPVTINQDMKALRCSERIEARFLQAVIHGAKPWLLANAGESSHGTKKLETEVIGRFPVPLPPLETQRAIADFLDAETARIDALIAAKESLLTILAEKHRALASQAVARGLDASAPMRESGIPWLGEVPAHWGVERSRWLFRVWDERSETGEEELLTVSHLTGVTPRSEKDVNMFEAASTVGYKVCHRGDLVINTMWAWMGAMGVAPCTGIVSPSYHVYRPDERLRPAYVDALVRTALFAQEVTRFSKGVWSSRLRLYPEGFFEVYLPVPPLEEQDRIITFIRDEQQRIDILSSAVDRSLKLAGERREAIIAAAVTGELRPDDGP